MWIKSIAIVLGVLVSLGGSALLAVPAALLAVPNCPRPYHWSCSTPTPIPSPTATPVPPPTPTPTPPTPTPAPTGDYLIIRRAELLSYSTTLASYTAMKALADQAFTTPQLADQNSVVAGQTVAAALVYARTGIVSYRTKVIGILQKVPTYSTSTASALTVGRQLGGFVIAAESGRP